MAMTLTDGRGELYQWDTGRTLTVDDATVTQVHFQNRAYGRTIDVDVNNSVAIIPDEILQKPGDLRVYAFSGTAESGFTKVERVFIIVRRNKPNDYMFTPTEQKSLEGLQKQIGDLSNLKTDAKTDIVSAINETATAGQTLGLTGATVGQVPAVKAVDGNGAPTEWEAVELPSGAYTVNLTMGADGSITADKTFAEIKAAYDDGKVVYAKFEYEIVPLQLLVDSEAVFALTNANSGGVFTSELTCTSDNVWSISEDGFAAYSLGLTGATVGQTVKIKAVDATGVPTEWEAADAASGGSGDKEWKLLRTVALPDDPTTDTSDITYYMCSSEGYTDQISNFKFSTDNDGKPFAVRELFILAYTGWGRSANYFGVADQSGNPGYGNLACSRDRYTDTLTNIAIRIFTVGDWSVSEITRNNNLSGNMTGNLLRRSDTDITTIKFGTFVDCSIKPGSTFEFWGR